jgi:ArsR family transcriptional regulator, arsenate/arsenite/antimonite-responsive transcriptional repressor / arsenate reductase (thioredoxin)
MSVATSPPVLGVLAHDLRWTIVGLLAPGDLRTSEIVERTGQAPNLVSYHLARLRDAGLVSARRSAADGRDSYHALDLDALGQAMAGAAGQIHPGLLPVSPQGRPGAGDRAQGSVHVLFICSGNSARSPMAAGWVNHLGGGLVSARSAGVTPAPLHPLAVAAMAEQGVNISGHQATPLTAWSGDTFDRVITLCDQARENCGELPPSGMAVHWSIPNPAQAHPPDLEAFRTTARELRRRIGHLLPHLRGPAQPTPPLSPS